MRITRSEPAAPAGKASADTGDAGLIGLPIAITAVLDFRPCLLASFFFFSGAR